MWHWSDPFISTTHYAQFDKFTQVCPEPRKPRDESISGEGRYGLRQEDRRPRMDRRRDSELSNVNGGDEYTMRAQARDESEVVCWHCREKGALVCLNVWTIHSQIHRPLLPKLPYQAR
jgi:hypothetical protein